MAGLVGIEIVVFGITWMWFGMCDVMDVGGFCAKGGTYEIRQKCPEGTTALIMGGIWIALAGLVAAAVGLIRMGRRALVLALLGWAGLYLALGWNFWNYDLNPSESGGDTVGILAANAIR